MLDIVPSCNHVQYQGKLMMQTCKIAKNLISSPILGPQNFFRGFYLTVASYHRMQFEGKPMIQLNQIPNAQTISLQIFKGCLPQILLGPFLNTLSNLLLGYFNSEPSENAMIEFCKICKLKPSCIDLILTNRPRSFHGCHIVETGLK